MAAKNRSSKSWIRKVWKKRQSQMRFRTLLLDQLERRDMLIATPAYFDFGPATNVEGGYTSVTAASAYSATQGYGFESTTGLTNSGAGNATEGNVLRDYVKGTTSKQFFVDLANGDYDVTVLMGATSANQTAIRVKLEDVTVADFNTPGNGYYIQTFHVTVLDGQLTVFINDLGTSADQWFLNGLTVKPHASPLPPLSSLLVDFGGFNSTLVSGYERATRLTAYSPAEQSFGWLGVTATTQSGATGDPLLSDYVGGASTPRTFVADMVNGSYDVTVMINSESGHNIGLRMEGAVVDTIGSIASYYKRTFRVEISDGQFTLSFEPPSSSSYPWTISALEIVPAADITPPPPLTSGHFDFGAANSTVEPGDALVHPLSWHSPQTQFGWRYYAASSAGSTTTFGDSMRNDWVESSTANTFIVDVVNGSYDVTVVVDTGNGTSQLRFEGLVVDTITASNLYIRTYRVEVSDGQLTFNLV